MSDSPQTLFENQSADGEGVAVSWRGGTGSFRVWGELAGGTASLQASFDGEVTWVDVEGAAMTAGGIKTFRLPVCHLRARLSGAAGSPSANVTAEI